MVLMALAFFIKADTKPVDPGPGKYGRTTSVVLYEAPSKGVAETWAKDFAQRRLLEDHPDQRLTSLKVIPIHDRLFTLNGDELIDWSAFVEQVRTMEWDDHRSNEFGIGMVFTTKMKPSPSSEPVRFDATAIKKQIPDANRYNWDEKKQSYYVLYCDNEAFVVRAMNMFVCSQPYALATKGTIDGGESVTVTTWPGSEKYQQ